MGHRDVTGVSPRYAILLELSDTLLCLGFDCTRAKEGNVRVIHFARGKLSIFSPYKIIVRLDGMRRPETFDGPTTTKKFLMTELM